MSILPCAAAPVSCFPFWSWISVAVVASSEAFSVCRAIFFDAHVWVSEVDFDGLFSFAGVDHAFVAGVVRSSWAV